MKPLKTYQFTVDYTTSTEEMIAKGSFDWVSDWFPKKISKLEPIRGSGKVEIKAVLVHLNRRTKAEEILQELNRRNLRPATLAELLAFGKERSKHPELQPELVIVALGSKWNIWDGVWYKEGKGGGVAHLSWYLSGRYCLEVASTNPVNNFGAHCKFLAIPKKN